MFWRAKCIQTLESRKVLVIFVDLVFFDGNAPALFASKLQPGVPKSVQVYLRSGP